MKIDTWKDCYPSQWKGVIVDDAIVHPAKFSSKLIKRIYEHIVEEGWVKEGDTIIDPFAGVSLGALDAMRLGLRWRGCELEPRFVMLGHGHDCPGVSKSAWVRWQGRLSRNKELCPHCQDGIGLVYITNSGIIPSKDEHRFLGNIDFWNSKFYRMPKWSGDAVLVQGDSRNLVSVLSGGGKASVSSPAYGRMSVEKNAGRSIDWKKQYESYKASGGGQTFEQFCATQEKHSQGYGESEGQLSAMPFTEKGYQASISSPPYADGAQHTGGDDTHPEHVKGGKLHLPGIAGSVSSPPYAESMERKGGIDPEKSEHVYGPNSQMANSDTRYGSTEGQLGAMPARADSFDASVSSPPFEDSLSRDFMNAKVRVAYARENDISNAEHISPVDLGRLKAPDDIYGDTAGQLGNDSGDDFWLAAREIVEQTYAILSPGAHAVWVVKGFVKNKQYVDFPDQWRQLCESVGFVTVHEHHATLVHRKGTQLTLDGGEHEIVTESKSFFRRLAEKKGSPRIDWETVLCMEKPDELGG